ncbi:MAG: hypothetical protein RIR45_1104 [Pseudomonadota bacterium]|jgi:general secretion pathway protein L
MTQELYTLDTGAETIAIVPVRALSWHRVQLPAGTLPGGWLKDRSAPRLRAVLEGLLEDQVLDDPAQLHFALQPDARTDAQVWVAVCDRQWLRSALLALEQAGPAPQRVVPEWTPQTSPSAAPDTASTPAQTGTLWCIGTEDAAQLVWADSEGVHRLPISSGRGLSAALPEHLRTSAEVFAEPTVAHLAEQLLRREVQVMPAQDRLRAAANTDWNLAQFDLARRNPLWARVAVAAHTFWTTPAWRPARWAAMALVLAQVAGLNAYAWYAQALLQQQRDAIRSTLVSTFPGVTVVVDAPLQMERELSVLRQASGSASRRDLEAMLGTLGSISATAAMDNAQVAIDFVAGELRLTGSAYDAERASLMDATLQPLGFAARLDGTDLLVQTRSAP